MEAAVFEKLAECIRTNTPAALVTVIRSEGSTPGKDGAVMVVWGDGSTTGTVGGGNLEFQAIKEAVSCITTGENKEVAFSLEQTGELGMTCGGAVKLYIKVFGGRPRLVIVGAGHIGLELYKMALLAGFSVVVVDDRAEFADPKRFPQAEQVLAGDITEILQKMTLNASSYVAIATRGHACDRQALEAVAGSEAAYVGMIGSTAKVKTIMQQLLKRGIPRETLEKVYAPMGLNIASIKPEEIALSILSEILLVKNSGSGEHMRTVKRVDW